MSSKFLDNLQILSICGEIEFNRDVENGILNNKLSGVLEKYKNKLIQSSDLVNSDDELIRIKIKSLILDLIHQRDVLLELTNINIDSLEQWEYQKLLKYYLSVANGEISCKIKMMNSEFSYTFEYQGNAPKLVHTPLTDKCYLTLTQGMNQVYC